MVSVSKKEVLNKLLKVLKSKKLFWNKEQLILEIAKELCFEKEGDYSKLDEYIIEVRRILKEIGLFEEPIEKVVGRLDEIREELGEIKTSIREVVEGIDKLGKTIKEGIKIGFETITVRTYYDELRILYHFGDMKEIRLSYLLMSKDISNYYEKLKHDYYYDKTLIGGIIIPLYVEEGYRKSTKYIWRNENITKITFDIYYTYVTLDNILDSLGKSNLVGMKILKDVIDDLLSELGYNVDKVYNDEKILYIEHCIKSLPILLIVLPYINNNTKGSLYEKIRNNEEYIRQNRVEISKRLASYIGSLASEANKTYLDVMRSITKRINTLMYMEEKIREFGERAKYYALEIYKELILSEEEKEREESIKSVVNLLKEGWIIK